MPPLISVVIVCRNPGPRLADAVASIAEQGDAAYELVIVDGASTDGTRAWLEQRRDVITRFISEPDRGVYDAMNKAIALAQGAWILFLGADDRLADRTVLARTARFLGGFDGDVACGEARFSDGRIYRFAGPGAAVRRNFAHHQGTFYRRAVFEQHGTYDASLRLQADYDLNLRLMRAGCRFATIPFRIAECAAGGLSDSGSWQNYCEEITVRHRHFPPLSAVAWDAGSIIRCARKKLLRRG